MTFDEEITSFGRYLRQIRLEKRISLDKISEETKIGKNSLRYIEAEDHQNLPAEVYVKGFLRAYARVIEVDEEEVSRRYRLSLEALENAADKKGAGPLLRNRLWPYLVMAVIVLLCMGTLSIYWAFYFVQQNQAGNKNGSESAIETVSEIQTTGSAKPVPLKKHPESVAEKWVLKVKAIEKTWMKVINDGQIPKEYTLNPDDVLTLEAATGFDLLIGNAKGLQLELNDKPVRILGKSGQVVSLKIP